MTDKNQNNDIDFTVDQSNLYREDAFTDLKVASVHRFTPVKPDGTEDKSRTPIFMGQTQLMTPEGPLPIQSRLPANNLVEAYESFPAVMEEAMYQMIEELKKYDKNKEGKGKGDSRIIVPGR